MSGGTIDSKSYGIVVNSGTYEGTGGTTQATAQAAFCVRNSGTATATSVTIIGNGTANGIINEREYGYCIIRNRSSNYGISGNIVGNVLATTNTEAGQASENVTIYNTGNQYLLFPTWTEKVVNGTNQDDIIWMKSNNTTGTHTVTINKADHNNETGTYNVHIYAANSNYEQQGNPLVGITLTF